MCDATPSAQTRLARIGSCDRGCASQLINHSPEKNRPKAPRSFVHFHRAAEGKWTTVDRARFYEHRAGPAAVESIDGLTELDHTKVQAAG